MSDLGAKSERARGAKQMARDIINQSWLDAGYTQEELDRDDQMINLLDSLVLVGYSEEALLAEWQTKTQEQILCEYTPKLNALQESVTPQLARKAA